MAATHQYDGTHKHIYPDDVTLGVDITKTGENPCTTESEIYIRVAGTTFIVRHVRWRSSRWTGLNTGRATFA